jgi:hypothetical protein
VFDKFQEMATVKFFYVLSVLFKDFYDYVVGGR